MLQILEKYLPSIDNDTILEIKLAPDENGWEPCNPEEFIYGPATTYWCSDLFMHEEEGNSTVSHNGEDRVAAHRAARQRVQNVWAQRGSIH